MSLKNKIEAAKIAEIIEATEGGEFFLHELSEEEYQKFLSDIELELDN